MPVTVIACPGGPEAGVSVSVITARAGDAGMASMRRERITDSAKIWKTLLYFISYLHYGRLGMTNIVNIL
jgi:hypothetical protein